VGTGWSVSVEDLVQGRHAFALRNTVVLSKMKPMPTYANLAVPKMMNTSKNGYGSRPPMPYLDLFGVDLFMHLAAILG
jgi:hypothetical protein